MTVHPRAIDVAATIDHGLSLHNMTATPEQARALAIPLLGAADAGGQRVLAIAVAGVGAGDASGPAQDGA